MCSCSYINKMNHHFYHSLRFHTHSASAYEFTVAIKTAPQGGIYIFALTGLITTWINLLAVITHTRTRVA